MLAEVSMKEITAKGTDLETYYLQKLETSGVIAKGKFNT